jgi:hypothetical protein
MARRKADMPAWIRANRLGCFVIAGVIAAFVLIAVYIGFSSPAQNEVNRVIRTFP